MSDRKLEQLENAELPIDVTLVGMQYDENLWLIGKHRLPIDVTVVGIV